MHNATHLIILLLRVLVPFVLVAAKVIEKAEGPVVSNRTRMTFYSFESSSKYSSVEPG